MTMMTKERMNERTKNDWERTKGARERTNERAGFATMRLAATQTGVVRRFEAGRKRPCAWTLPGPGVTEHAELSRTHPMESRKARRGCILSRKKSRLWGVTERDESHARVFRFLVKVWLSSSVQNVKADRVKIHADEDVRRDVPARSVFRR
jgi:hypothetical protein